MRCLALATTWLALGCFAQEPTQPAPFLDATDIQAHSPAYYGVATTLDAASTPDYTNLDAASAADAGGSLHLSVVASGTIPRFPDGFVRSVAVFGYAWVDGETNRGIVAVIHPTIGRDSHQNPDGWHTHPVLLSAGTASSTFCLAGIGPSQGGLTLRDKVLALNIALRQAGVSATALDVAASFVVVGDAGCAELAPGVRLGVQVLDTQTL
jgi:hypothetical protein